MQRIDVLSFEPPFKHFSDSLIGNIDLIIDSVMTIPRLETQLYLDYQGDPVYLKVTIQTFALQNLPKIKIVAKHTRRNSFRLQIAHKIASGRC